jgi:uncharacterized phage protein gp47/JayE
MSNYTGRTSLEDQTNAYREEMENQFGVDFKTGTASNNFRLTYPILSELVVRYNKLEDWLNQRNLYNAEGINLDNNLGDFNFLRKQPSKAIVEWTTLDSTSGTSVGIGDLQIQDGKGRVFENVSIGTVDGSGDLTLTMQSLLTGPDQNINAGALTQIVTPVSGINTGSNTFDAAGGQDKEGDFDYRTRFILSGSTQETLTVDGLRNAILEVDGVLSAKVYENDTTSTDGLGVPTKAVYAVVLGGSDAEVAQAIYDNSDPAIFRYGTDVVETIKSESGQDIFIRFDRQTNIIVEYEITIDPGGYDTTEIEARIEEYITDSGINELLTEYKAVKFYINPNIDTSGINDLQIKFRRQSVGGTYFSTLQMNEVEKAVNV